MEPTPLPEPKPTKVILYRAADLRPEALRVELESWPYGLEIHDRALLYGIEPELAYALMWIESKGDPLAISAAGARGLLQVLPSTAGDYGARPDDLFDPTTNIDVGLRHFRFLLELFENNEAFAISAYNAGHVPVFRYGIPPFKETRRHVRRVLQFRDNISSRVDKRVTETYVNE